MSESAYVAIGRTSANTGHDLPKDQWREFQLETRHAIEDAGGKVFFFGEGFGVWEESAEPSYVIGFATEHVNWSALRSLLWASAVHYEQIAISVVCSEPDFIFSAE